MNVAVYDPAWVKAARQHVLSLILPPDEAPANDTASWIYQMEWAAYLNSWAEYEWALEGGDIDLDGDPLPEIYQTSGFLYQLQFDDPSECLFEDVGPDMM